MTTQKPITATGIKGFLLWFARDQPALYAKVAPTLPKIAPGAFSNALGRLRALKGIYKTGVARRAGTIGKLADYSDYTDSGPITVDYSAQLDTIPSYSGPVTVNYTDQLSQTPTYTNDQLAADATPTPLDTDSNGNVIANSANTGTAAASTTGAIGSAIAAAANGSMSASQAAALATLVAQQLARAASGSTPANTSSSQFGVPTVSSGMSTTTILVLLAAAGAAAWALAS